MSSADSTGVLCHHFDNMEQQHGSARLGMWAFLVTEAMFFGGLFVAYTAYRIWYPADFLVGSSKLNVLIGGINSLLLLTSSLTITLAIHAAHANRQDALKKYLLWTIFFGLAFMCFKAREYYLDYQEHLIPGALFNTPVGSEPSPAVEVEHKDHANAAHVQLFFMFYYIMTGLHVLHMIVGIGLIGWIYILARRGYFIPRDRYVYVEVTSLYWHFVDMVWFVLMAILYCAGPHSIGQLHL